MCGSLAGAPLAVARCGRNLMATKLSRTPLFTQSNLMRLVALGIALTSAIGPSCSDSRKSQQPAAPIARALAEPNWASGVTYRIGDLVQYNGIVYECRQDHTSAVGWEPPNVLSLWQRP